MLLTFFLVEHFSFFFVIYCVWCATKNYLGICNKIVLGNLYSLRSDVYYSKNITSTKLQQLPKQLLTSKLLW